MSVAQSLHEDGRAIEAWVPEDTFGARLALVRQRLGWNVTQAAKASGTTDQSWHNWESGGSPRNYERICRQISEASGCNYLWLLAGEAAVPTRSRWFSPLSLVSGTGGQMELDFTERPSLTSV